MKNKDKKNLNNVSQAKKQPETREEKDKYFYVWGMRIRTVYFLLSLFLLFVAWILFTIFWGFKEIGRFGEKRNYTTQYWVYLQPENSEAKSYRVKADIERIIPDYYLRKVYWPDGGYGEFDDCQLTIWDGEFRYIPDDGSISCLLDEESGRYNIRVDKKVY